MSGGWNYLEDSTDKPRNDSKCGLSWACGMGHPRVTPPCGLGISQHGIWVLRRTILRKEWPFQENQVESL